jgi:hypothetical protein
MYTSTHEASRLYQAESTIGENRRRYFEANGFGEGGYEEKWVTLKKMGPLNIGFPNSEGRVRAVRLHDIHHVVAGYGTDWTGEAEIGAFELGAGCGKHYAAWVLNGGTLLYGVWIAPRAVFRAFVRGRHAESLYGGEWRDSLLEENTGELRKKLRVDGPPPRATVTDALAFAGFLFAAAAVTLTPVLALGALAYAFFA